MEKDQSLYRGEMFIVAIGENNLIHVKNWFGCLGRTTNLPLAWQTMHEMNGRIIHAIGLKLAPFPPTAIEGTAEQFNAVIQKQSKAWLN